MFRCPVISWGGLLDGGIHLEPSQRRWHGHELGHGIGRDGHRVCLPKGLGYSRTSRTTCHQSGCGWNRSVAHSGAPMAEVPGSGFNAADRRLHVGGRQRSADAEECAHPVSQPSNGATHAAWGRDASLTVARPLAAGRSPRSPRSPPASPDRPARRRARHSRLDPAARNGGFALRRHPARPRRRHRDNSRY